MFWKRQGRGGSRKVSGSQGLGMGAWWRTRWVGKAQRIFRAVKLLCMILLKNKVMFVKTHRVYNTKREPSCKLWTLEDSDVSV